MLPAVDGHAPIRVLLAIGDPERERRLLEGLLGNGLVVTARCLDGPSLAERAGGPDVDVALVSGELHRLTTATLIAVQEARLPLVLTADPAAASRYGGLAHLLPATAGPLEVSQALQAAVRSGPSYAPASPASSAIDGGSAYQEDTAKGGGGDVGSVIAVLSGKGAPGATTVAIAVAAALAERGRRVVLLDADLSGGNVGAYLDLDPRRSLFALAYGRQAGQDEWERRVQEELQDGPGFLVLNGIERAEQRSTVSVDVLTTALATLRRSFDDVVVDMGAVIPGRASAATDALLRAADRLLLVANADVVALWNAQAALRQLTDALGISREAIGVVMNRRSGREHYDAEEVTHALRVPVLAVVAEDWKAARRAIAEQLPLTAVGGRAARGLQRLAAELAAREPAEAAASPTAKRSWLPAGRRA